MKAWNDTKKRVTKSWNYDVDLELRMLTARNVEERILSNLVTCRSYKEMLDKLDKLYGLRCDDLEQLHNQFQNFRINPEQSIQENVCRLETIKSKIELLGENISDMAFRTKLSGVLPWKYSGFVLACNLNQNLRNSDIISALNLEELRLQKFTRNDQPSTSKQTVTCFFCKKVGHKANACCNKKGGAPESISSRTENKQSGIKAVELECYYCKERGHGISKCEKLAA